MSDHTTIRSGCFPDDASPEATELASRLGQDPFLPMYLAADLGTVFLSEDRPTRIYAEVLGGAPGLWLQPVLMAASANALPPESYAKGIAQLAARRHAVVSAGSRDFVALYRSDRDGSLSDFRKLARALGGEGADFESHVMVVAETVHAIIHPLDDRSHLATGILLDNLVRGRTDFIEMLGYLAALLGGDENFIAYLDGWIRGHFYPGATIGAAFRVYNRQIRTHFRPTIVSLWRYHLRNKIQRRPAA